MQLVALLSFLYCMVVGTDAAAVVRSSTKPAIIMVPGAFHSPRTFYKVVDRLGQAGYEFLDAVALPSVGHVVGRQADTDAVKEVLYKHINAGRDVVLVGNSKSGPIHIGYGCTVIGEAVKDAPRYTPGEATSAAETSGKVISLVYLAGYIPTIEEVEHPETKPDIHGLSPIFNIHDNNGTITADADMVNYPPQKAFYDLLPESEADYWTSQLDFESFEAANATATYIPYTGDFEVVYVVGSEDHAVTTEMSNMWIDQPQAQFIVEHLYADHISMLSKPDEVAELIKKYSVKPSA